MSIVMVSAFVGCGLAALLGPAIVEKEPLVSAQAFTEKAAGSLNDRLPAAEPRVLGELVIALKDEKGRETVVSVGNFYYDHACNEDKRAGAIDALVAALTEQRSERARTLDRARIVPIVRSRHWLAETERLLKVQAPGQALLVENLSDELVIVYAEDRAEVPRFLMADEKVGLKGAALRKRATDNLLRIFSRVQMRGHEDFLVVSGGDYAASIVLLDFASYQPKGSPLAVAAPTTNVLLLGSAQHRETLAAMRKYAVELAGPHRAPPAGTLLIFRGGGFVRLAPE